MMIALTREQFVDKLLKTRYFTEGETSWPELVERVAKHGSSTKHTNYYQQFYDLIVNKDFLPSRMPYMGSRNPFSSSCFVFEFEDDWESIFNALHDAVAVQRFGGGTGFNFGTLRPKGSLISTTKGKASGPVSFMHMFQDVYKVLKRAGNKMAANMAVMDISHPDVEEFITCKNDEGELWCFNISVRISDKFMKAVKNDENWALSWKGEIYKTVKASYLWNLLIENSYMLGEPGIQFSDTIDRTNSFPVRTIASNPCSEQNLPDRTSCNLGAINLSHHITDAGEILWDKLEDTIRIAVRFLDGSLASAWFPLQSLRDNANKYRNIGLSIMGWHDFLIMADIPYDSQEALELAEHVQQFISVYAEDESRKIGYEETGNMNKVNTTLTTIQPTGSLSVIAGVGSAIEPFYSPIENRFSYVGTYSDIFPTLLRKFEYEGWNIEEIVNYVDEHHSLLNCPFIPENKRQLFAVTNEIPWQVHVKMQAAFQKHLDQAVSKTINLDNSATPDDIAKIYEIAWKTGCKSITVYRQGSRDVEILSTEAKDDSYFCPECLKHKGEKMILIRDGGCNKCSSPNCDYSLCTI